MIVKATTGQIHCENRPHNEPTPADQTRFCQINANFIFCFRAKEKMKIVRARSPRRSASCRLLARSSSTKWS